ncbi:MAG: hypothetical protein KDB88_10550, partial [Flavobacteriales bacterium]|nr:hypothetical protein [Flavobacteriales bacterium]
MAALAQYPVVQSAVDAMDLDSLVHFVGELSGEVPVDVGSGPVTIVSRHKLAAGNPIAADLLEQRLAEWGYVPQVQVFSGGTGENILAVKQGSLYPERRVILCGHYDAMPGGPVA